ncbi:MAG: hypothetical protein CML68_13555 [Rhodobacteraceae bacterium]|nr:hypothetical protein [Paracoccaceae bacterium]
MTDPLTAQQDARKALCREMDAGWRPINTAPKDGRFFEAWHIIHKCTVTVRPMDTHHNGCGLIERTMTTTWPVEAFSHWRKPSEPPCPTSSRVMEALREDAEREGGE